MKTTNTKKFWQEFDNISIANDKNKELDLLQEMKKPDGSLTSSIDETLQSWTDHFDRLFNPLQLDLI